MIDWLSQDVREPQIELAGRSLPIVLKRHARAKRLSLRLAPDGSEVRITLPQWAGKRQAIAFAHARRSWLEEQLARIPERTPPVPGGTFALEGEPVRIDWREDAPRKPVFENMGRVLTLGGPRELLEVRIRKWLEARALEVLAGDCAHYCAAAGVDNAPVKLSRARRRWGSCSDRRSIRINWRLVQAPAKVRRSVVAHEVAHLVHFDHSEQFHGLLKRIYEGDIAYADHWLKRHGPRLYATFG